MVNMQLLSGLQIDGMSGTSLDSSKQQRFVGSCNRQYPFLEVSWKWKPFRLYRKKPSVLPVLRTKSWDHMGSQPVRHRYDMTSLGVYSNRETMSRTFPPKWLPAVRSPDRLNRSHPSAVDTAVLTPQPRSQPTPSLRNERL